MSQLTLEANLDEHNEPEDIDEETTGHLHREIEKAEEEGYSQGKPGSFLNKLVSDSSCPWFENGRTETSEDHARQQEDGRSDRERVCGFESGLEDVVMGCMSWERDVANERNTGRYIA